VARLTASPAAASVDVCSSDDHAGVNEVKNTAQLADAPLPDSVHGLPKKVPAPWGVDCRGTLSRAQRVARLRRQSEPSSSGQARTMVSRGSVV
jgi:hypothetical protein